MTERFLPQNEDNSWIDQLFNNPESEETEYNLEAIDSSKELKVMPIQLFDNLYYDQFSKPRSMNIIASELQAKFEAQSLVMDPTACGALCDLMEKAIAHALQNASNGKYYYENSRAGTAFIGSKETRYTMGLEEETIHTGKVISKIPYGRVTAKNDTHILIVDRYYANGEMNDHQLMLFQRFVEDPDYIETALLMDLRQGFKPYNNISVYGNVSHPAFRDNYYLRNLCNSLIGINSAGDLPIPELI